MTIKSRKKATVPRKKVTVRGKPATVLLAGLERFLISRASRLLDLEGYKVVQIVYGDMLSLALTTPADEPYEKSGLIDLIVLCDSWDLGDPREVVRGVRYFGGTRPIIAVSDQEEGRIFPRDVGEEESPIKAYEKYIKLPVEPEGLVREIMSLSRKTYGKELKVNTREV